MTDTNFISPEGLEKLKEELEYKSKILRKQISEAIGVAKEQGDLSENFEYQDAKERQGTNEVRIAAIKDMIRDAIVVEKKTGETSVTIGVGFKVELDDGSTKDFELVGSTETDPTAGKISNESPLGNAFIGKEVGETVEIKLPSGVKTYKIISIQ